jgi:hypothetical protein
MPPRRLATILRTQRCADRPRRARLAGRASVSRLAAGAADLMFGGTKIEAPAPRRGFQQFTGAIAKRPGLDEHHANRLIAEDGAPTGKIAELVLGATPSSRHCATLPLVTG